MDNHAVSGRPGPGSGVRWLHIALWTVLGLLAWRLAGVILASPLILVMIVAIQVFYLEGVLGAEAASLAPSWLSRNWFRGARVGAASET
jgi:hypothetical protein